MTGDNEAVAAWAAMLRWGWRPQDFLTLCDRERAFVIAGLMLEKEVIGRKKQGRG